VRPSAPFGRIKAAQVFATLDGHDHAATCDEWDRNWPKTSDWRLGLSWTKFGSACPRCACHVLASRRTVHSGRSPRKTLNRPGATTGPDSRLRVQSTDGPPPPRPQRGPTAATGCRRKGYHGKSRRAGHASETLANAQTGALAPRQKCAPAVKAAWTEQAPAPRREPEGQNSNLRSAWPGPVHPSHVADAGGRPVCHCTRHSDWFSAQPVSSPEVK